MPVVHAFDAPERFIVGTVGPPGARVFFLQAREGTRLTSVALEKLQVQALSERIDELLDEVMRAEENSALIPAAAPFDLIDNNPLEQPIEEEFRAGTMTLSWDLGAERIVIEVFPFAEAESDEAEEAEPDEVFLVRLTAGGARAFVGRARTVVGAGRPDCPFCGNPIDPDGHLCVRANGFRRRDPQRS